MNDTGYHSNQRDPNNTNNTESTRLSHGNNDGNIPMCLHNLLVALNSNHEIKTNKLIKDDVILIQIYNYN